MFDEREWCLRQIRTEGLSGVEEGQKRRATELSFASRRRRIRGEWRLIGVLGVLGGQVPNAEELWSFGVGDGKRSY